MQNPEYIDAPYECHFVLFVPVPPGSRKKRLKARRRYLKKHLSSSPPQRPINIQEYQGENSA